MAINMPVSKVSINFFKKDNLKTGD